MFVDNGMEFGVQPAFSAPDMAGNIPFKQTLSCPVGFEMRGVNHQCIGWRA